MSVIKPMLLCVDDDAQCLAVRRIVFETYGFNVVTSTSPRQGLRLHEGKRFDAAVVDFQMPEMNGAELTRLMKSSRPDVPVLILSGLPYLPEDIPAFHDSFLCKTEPNQKIIRVVRELISHSPNGNGNGAHLSLQRRFFAAAGIVLGFASEGAAQARLRWNRKRALIKSAKFAEA